jgi:SAM-dependent methyltransferase
MERCSSMDAATSALRDEHAHRYKFAAKIAYGNLVDCACGIGYGSRILLSSSAVKAYLGIDPSIEALQVASSEYSNAKARFEEGTIERNTALSGSVDTYVMFETLEHTTNPAAALDCIVRSLNPSGLLIGSVPSLEYEETCEQVYGPNPYHLHRFSLAGLKSLLTSRFEAVEVFSAEFRFGTLFCRLGAPEGNQRVHTTDGSDQVLGSLVFIAGSAVSVKAALSRLGNEQEFYPSVAKVLADNEEIIPLKQAFNRAEAMIQDRDQALLGKTQRIDALADAAINDAKLIISRDIAIISQGKMLEERWQLLVAAQQETANLTRASAQDRTLVANLFRAYTGKVLPEENTSAGLSELSHSLMDSKRLLDNLQFNSFAKPMSRSARKQVQNLLRSSTPRSPFAELGATLFLFIRRLYDQAIADGAEHLLFFAREGQMIKQLFDQYALLHKSARTPKTHYFLASRRSTFLMSLGPLQLETFDTLFRQYRKISTSAFLKSLGLITFLPNIALSMGIPESDFETVHDDLPTSEAFQKLISDVTFITTYEAERLERKRAFESYLSSLLPGGIPTKLYVVDVGWKGSIQDNIQRWKQSFSPDYPDVIGYYLGLVASGGASNQNKKKGLLFSCLEGKSNGFSIFAENRALFEILLHADHGSAYQYKFDANGVAVVLLDTYDEREMIEKNVLPISNGVLHCFTKMLAVAAVNNPSDIDLLKITLQLHQRMVFKPTHAEISWIRQVRHVENFGVFEESSFTERLTGQASFTQKTLFTLELARPARAPLVVFWPWLAIRENALPGVSSAYRWFRLAQSKFHNLAGN